MLRLNGSIHHNCLSNNRINDFKIGTFVDIALFTISSEKEERAVCVSKLLLFFILISSL